MQFYLTICLFMLATIELEAQPQAPILWDSVHVIYNNPDWPTRGITAFGDTLVLHSVLDTNALSLPAVCVSASDGQTWSPWHVFDDDWNNWGTSPAAFTTQGLSCLTFHYQYSTLAGLSRTTDLGWTWQAPCTTAYFIPAELHADGDMLYARAGQNIYRTADGGCHYAVIPCTTLASIHNVIAGGGWIHLADIENDSVNYRRVMYTRARASTGQFEPRRILNPGIRWTHDVHLDCDGEGTVMVLTAAEWTTQNFAAAQIVYISRDFGATWAAPETLSYGETADFSNEGIWHEGSRWVAFWYDSTLGSGFAHRGDWCAFSANRGRSWYPSCQIEDDSAFGGRLVDGEIRGNRIRLYGCYDELMGQYGHYFVRWEGQLLRDSLAPILNYGGQIANEIPPGTAVTFTSTASDNDSLWLMQVVLKRQGSTDSLVVPLSERVSPTDYRGMWTVPNDTALWHYYYRAEDMWENVSVFPDTGEFSFHTTGWSSVSHVRLPLSYLEVSAYPNPSNGTVIFLISHPSHSTPVEICVYDLLGRQVAFISCLASSIGMSRIVWDTRGLNGEPLSSGVYFARVAHATASAVSRIVILR
jgi:hypothetical protein